MDEIAVVERTVYTNYLMAYGSTDKGLSAIDEHNNHPPRSEPQLIAHALGLLDWRKGHEARTRSRLLADVNAMMLNDEKREAKDQRTCIVNTVTVDLGALKAEVDKLIAAVKGMESKPSATVETVAKTGDIAASKEASETIAEIRLIRELCHCEEAHIDDWTVRELPTRGTCGSTEVTVKLVVTKDKAPRANEIALVLLATQ